jgi:hypothetical protein
MQEESKEHRANLIRDAERGRDLVRGQIDKVVTIVKLCENREEFRAKFARDFKKKPLQVSFDEINWTASE